MKNIDAFTGKANIYNKSRPSYPNELINHISQLGINANSTIADIGSGTGKFSELLLSLNAKTYCVEPNEDMRLLAEKSLNKHPNFISINGSADNTTLDNKSIDLITVAQAFHWFDKEAFYIECKRILKNNGIVYLIWNTNIMTEPIIKEIEEVNNKYCPSYVGFNGGIFNNESKIYSFFNNQLELATFPNNQIYNKANFINRLLSSSYALTTNDNNYQDYITALNDIFNKHSENDYIIMPIETKCYYGKLID